MDIHIYSLDGLYYLKSQWTLMFIVLMDFTIYSLDGLQSDQYIILVVKVDLIIAQAWTAFIWRWWSTLGSMMY